MESLRVERRDNVVLVRLDRGVTNALCLQTMEELGSVIEQVEKDPTAPGLVITSANEKFFSIGFDLPQLFGVTPDEFRTFYRTFNRVCLDLFRLPRPTVAALPGHGVAGGCILALCCDYRFIAQGRKLMGLNEIKLGVPVPYIADCALRSIVGARRARDVMESGDLFDAAAASELGMVDAVLPVEEVIGAAVERAGRLASFPAAAYAKIKKNRIAAVERRVLDTRDAEEDLFVALWTSEPARGLLRAAMETF